MTDHTLPANEIAKTWSEIGQERKTDSAQGGQLPDNAPFEIVRSKRRSESTMTVEPNPHEQAAFTPPQPSDEFTFEGFTANAKAAVDAISNASRKFEADFGKPNTKLHAALKRVEAAELELREAQAELNAVQAEGDSVDRYVSAVNRGVRAFEALGNYARTIVGNSIMMKLLGRVLPRQNRDEGIVSILKNHARTAAIDQLRGYVQPIESRASESVLKNKAKEIVALIERLAKRVEIDHKENSK
jgi:hypothetical protein